ncbi:hypothetical protein AB0N50_08520 [Streptomyces pharetrae]|uniref:hypothetical protein n=1 Tax=Streptomyces pharetrae TaxID=291370 RepID=UPI003460D0F7
MTTFLGRTGRRAFRRRRLVGGPRRGVLVPAVAAVAMASAGAEEYLSAPGTESQAFDPLEERR